MLTGKHLVSEVLRALFFSQYIQPLASSFNMQLAFMSPHKSQPHSFLTEQNSSYLFGSAQLFSTKSHLFPFPHNSSSPFDKSDLYHPVDSKRAKVNLEYLASKHYVPVRDSSPRTTLSQCELEVPLPSVPLGPSSRSTDVIESQSK